MHEGERFNSYSHLVGVFFSVIGLIILLFHSITQMDLWKTVSFTLYGITLILLYSVSTIYHSHQGLYKHIWQKFDYLSIYLFIAGSYMPFALVTLKENNGGLLFWGIWLLAALGITSEFIPRKGKRLIPIVIYLSMGWLITLMYQPLTANLGPTGTGILITSGVFYTFGITFYVFDSKVKHFHGIWHLFVLAGSTLHYSTVLIYVAMV